jgi:hypothetical protein
MPHIGHGPQARGYNASVAARRRLALPEMAFGIVERLHVSDHIVTKLGAFDFRRTCG